MPEWIENLSAVAAGTDDTRITLFSAHDSSIGPILSAMEVVPEHFPGYGSNVHINR